jgi:hypothetical protein
VHGLEDYVSEKVTGFSSEQNPALALVNAPKKKKKRKFLGK